MQQQCGADGRLRSVFCRVGSALFEFADKGQLTVGSFSYSNDSTLDTVVPCPAGSYCVNGRHVSSTGSLLLLRMQNATLPL
jgi:hypothetical protein